MADPGDIQGAAQDIVSQPKYRVPEPGVVQSVIGWIGDRLAPVGDAIGRFLAWLAQLVGLSAGGVAAGGGGFLLGWIVLAAGAALVVWFLIRVMPRRRLRKTKQDTPTIEQRSHHRTTRREWLERAAAAEAERDFTGAVRARYRALIAGLADRHEVEDDDSVTSGEHLRGFDPALPKHDRFASATDTFERAWYGEHPVGSAESSDLQGIDRELVDERRRS